MKFEKEQMEDSMRRLVRFMLRYKKKWAATGFMLMLGVGTAAGAYFYVPKDFPVITSEEVSAAFPDTDWVTESTAKIVAESTAEAREWVPTPGELNLAHYFPEGADQSDMTKSLAGDAFKVLMTHDEDWISGIYDFSDITPSQMAARLGISELSVMGHYNPKDSRHDRSNPDTWTINTFKNIRMTAQDGDGNPITPYSNVPEIMSMANLYTYFKGVEDYDLFLSYSKELWELSHSYTVSMSELYFCSGCMSEDAERKEMEELEAAAKAEALGLATEESTESSSESAENAETVGESSSAATTVGSSVIVAGISASEKAAEASEASVKAARTAAATQETVPESTSGVIVSRRNEKATGAASETLETAVENTEAATEESDSNAGSTAATEESSESLATSSNASTAADAESETTAAAILSDCPGHVDLIINMKIIGLDETNNLFEKDATGRDEAGFEENGWQGWTRYTKASARLLSNQDWFAKYGLTVSSISARNPLTNTEIEAYMAELPADLSQTRKDIIRFALNSVGKVPYYWGGKPAAPSYASNSFGILTTPDYKGRVYKGLDCSGWINWVYWSVTGRRLPYESTSGLAVSGTKIQRNELQPGDIIVRTGADAHVIMFLGWTPDGRIRCIHESSAAVNNVTVAVRDANWSYYRKIVD